MYYNLLTRKQDPAYSRLKGLTRLLLNFIDVKCIYFSDHIGKPINQGIVTVIITADSPHYWDDIYEYLWKVVQAFPEFSLRIYNEEWLQEEIQEGCLFFILHCRHSSLIYSENDSILSIYKISAKRLAKLAKKRLREYTTENRIIGRDLKYHIRSQNYLMAAYVIQQQLRNLYICASWLLSGEWHVLQSLAGQSEHLSRYSTLPQQLFNPDNPKEYAVLKQLDRSCAVVQGRTKKSQSINEETINSASGKLRLAVKEIETLFEDCIKKGLEILNS